MDADAIARLKELAALKEAGILTEEEFSQQKAAILSGGGKPAGPRCSDVVPGRCCGKSPFELSEEDLADLRSIERRVKLDDRPWSGEWFFFLEMMVLVYFVLMAVLMAATGAPKYETNSDNEIEGVHPRYEDDAKKCCDKAAGPGNPWGAWEYSEMCWEMEAAGQWDPPPFTGQCTAPTACRADGSSCATDEFCDFTGGSVGECRSCAGYDSAKACYGGLFQPFPLTGSEDCHACCFPATRRRLAKKKHTPKPKTIWEGFSLHPGIPLGVIAVIMFLCFGFLKLMEKFAKTVLFGTFFAEAVFCLYLGFAGKFEAVRAVVWTIIALAIGIYVAFMRKKIVKAGDCISVAATALLSMPSLMATVYAWMLASALLVVVLIAVAVASGNQAKVVAGSEKDLFGTKYATCDWETRREWGFVMLTLVCIWKWMWAYLVMTQVYFVSGCVAQFNFDRNLVTKAMPLTLIKLAFTKSAGTVGKSALILQFINWVKKNSKISGKNCCWTCVKLATPLCWPMLLLVVVVRCCCFTAMEMLNKFALIFHVITGDEFWLSAKRCYKLMKHAGLDALVMETSAMNSFIIIGYGLSVGVGVFTWWWAGVEYGKDVLGNEDMWGEEDEYINGWHILMLVTMMILLLVPTFAIFLTVIIAMAVTDITRCWIPWFCGLFCGGVCAQFFWQTVNALLIASNSTFVCIAIDKVNNVAVPADKDNALYALAQADIVTASELAKVEPAKADAGAATAVAAQPVANVPAAVPDVAPAAKPEP